jgi:hypothetical protein
MKINKVSILKKTILVFIILMCILLAIAVILFIKPDNDFIYILLLWALGSIYVLITNLLTFDIEIENDIVFLRRILSQRELNLVNLKIFEARAVNGPCFLMETSTGNIRINYTNKNYQQILELLKRIAPHRIKLLEWGVKRMAIFFDLGER